MARGLTHNGIPTLVGVDGIIGQENDMFLKERHHLHGQRKNRQPVDLLVRIKAPQWTLPGWMAPQWTLPDEHVLY